MLQTLEQARLEEDKKVIYLENKQLELSRKLEANQDQDTEATARKKLSKRAQKRLDKLMADPTKSETEKIILRNEILG